MKLSKSLILATGLLAASNAHAAIIGNLSVSLDWGNLGIELSNGAQINTAEVDTGDGTLISSAAYAHIGYDVPTPTEPPPVGDVNGAPVSLSYNDSLFTLTSGYTPETIAPSSPFPGFNADTTYNYAAINNSTEDDMGGYAGAGQTKLYTVTSGGTLTFTIPYTLSGSLSVSNSLEYGNGWGSYKLYAGDFDAFMAALEEEGTTEAEAEAEAQLGLAEETAELLWLYFGCGDCVSSISESDTFELSFDVTTGQTIFFEADTEVWLGSQISPIPVPAAVWLFGSGLIGLVGVARRKKS